MGSTSGLDSQALWQTSKVLAPIAYGNGHFFSPEKKVDRSVTFGKWGEVMLEISFLRIEEGGMLL